MLRSDDEERGNEPDTDLAWMAPIYQKFDEQLLILNEQKAAQAEEAKRAENHRVFIEDKLVDVCSRLTQVESTTVDLAKRLDALETCSRSWKSLEERYQAILSEMLSDMYREMQDKYKQDLESLERKVAQQQNDLNRIKILFTKPEMKSTPRTQPNFKISTNTLANDPPMTTPVFSRMASATSDPCNMSENSRPVQRPGGYSGDSLWKSYLAQFEITAQLNGWSDQQKAAYLATSLKGPALNVLGNLPPERRRDYQALVSALESRYGSAHRTELSRVRFKHRVKQRDESLAALAEDIERLGRLAYPEAAPELQNVLSRDQFIDALPDEDMRLRTKQERPQSLQRALEVAMELESFQIASRQRHYRASFSTELQQTREERDKVVEPSGSSETTSLANVLERLEKSLRECLNGVVAAVGNRPRNRGRRDPSTGCWACGKHSHFRRDCPMSPKDPGSPKKSVDPEKRKREKSLERAGTSGEGNKSSGNGRKLGLRS